MPALNPQPTGINPADYDYWYAALDGKKPAIHDRDPQCGYYTYRYRTGPDAQGRPRAPVVVWRRPDGLLGCRVGYKGFEGASWDINSIWVEIAASPITEEVYELVFEQGRYPDDLPPEALARPKAPPARTSDGQPRPNAPAEPTDKATELSEAIDTNVRLAGEVQVTDDVSMARAQGFRARLLELGKEADTARTEEKGPHLKACKVIDGRWMPVVRKAEEAAGRVRTRIGAFLTERDRQQAEALRVQREAEAKALAAGTPPALHIVTPDTETPPVASPARVKGSYGRAAAIVNKRIGKVEDYGKFAAYLLAPPFDSAALREFLDAQAGILAKMGAEGVAGIVSFETVKDVR